MTYHEMIDIIEHKRRFGKASGYEVSRELLSLLQHPERKMRMIHIAGTNGKGSTAAFLSSILRAAGFCVGQFTSPHLIDFTERIQVNGVPIPREQVIILGEEVLALEDTLRSQKLDPTMFDFCLAIALLYYRQCSCDYVILETGLGGRLDSTNAIDHAPVVSIFTNIGLDHTAILGDSIEAIAGEKAGILKPATTAVLAPMEPAAASVIRRACDGMGIPVAQAGKDGLVQDGKPLMLGLTGEYQKENAATAKLAAEVLMDKNEDIFLMRYLEGMRQEETEPCIHGCDGSCASCQQSQPYNYQMWKHHVIRQGLEQARWPGRMEIVSRQPWMLLDGAHNPQGVHALADSLRQWYPQEKFYFVVGVLADKDYPAMIEEILPLGEQFYTVTVESSRALQGEALASYLTDQGVKAESFDSIDRAMKVAREACGGLKQRLVVFGSLYFIGSVKRWLAEENEKKSEQT